jgi:MFS transporter, BCD family, chlorophyll transporter
MSRMVRAWTQVSTRYLPFADAASAELPMPRLLRLGLFQITVGMALTILVGTLNRVMIVELRVPAALVALMLGLPLIAAPFRTLVGFRSDVYESALGWKRVPFLWFGTLLQFGGLAIMPFALILLSGDTHGSLVIGRVASALAILLVGAGAHTAQTAGLSLATDLAPAPARPRVVALLYVMLLAGIVGSSLVFGRLLHDFTEVRLIQVIQGSALVTVVLNVIAMWKQEPRRPRVGGSVHTPSPRFAEAWRAFMGGGRVSRLLVGLAIGTAGFGMQDVLIEPYGGQVLHLGVGSTTLLTAMLAGGAIIAFAIAGRVLTNGGDPIRLAAYGAIIGVGGSAAIIFAAPLASLGLFRLGTVVIGLGNGLFAVGTLTAAMGLEERERTGLALGAWGAVQATSAGLAIVLGGGLRDAVAHLAARGVLGEAMRAPMAAYSVVYHLEILLLFVAVVSLGPLVRPRSRSLTLAGGLAQ